MRHRFFNIPNVHSTSFRTLSRFEEKYPSVLATSTCVYDGKMDVGQRKFPLPQMKYIPTEIRIRPHTE